MSSAPSEWNGLLKKTSPIQIVGCVAKNLLLSTQRSQTRPPSMCQCLCMCVRMHICMFWWIFHCFLTWFTSKTNTKWQVWHRRLSFSFPCHVLVQVRDFFLCVFCFNKHRHLAKEEEMKEWRRERGVGVGEGVWIMASACPPAVPSTCTSECGGQAKRRERMHTENVCIRSALSSRCNRSSISTRTNTKCKADQTYCYRIWPLSSLQSQKNKKVQIPDPDFFFPTLWTEQHK